MEEPQLQQRIEEAARSFSHDLWLYDREAASLPPAIGNLAQLKRLAIGCESLTSLPPDIGRLANLIEFEVRYSKLSWLPESLRNLVRLSSLSISSTSPDELTVPEWIGDLACLEVLRLEGNVQRLPRSIGELRHLKTVAITPPFGAPLNHEFLLPEEFGRLECLEDVSLTGSRLSCLPRSIGALRSLRTLRLGYNLLDRLPEEIGDLASLRVLNLEANRLTELPRTIGHLAALEDLRLNGNLLMSLPDEISGLARLVRLGLQDNRLVELPRGIKGLRALTALDVRSNQLENLPGEIGQISSLESLRARGNRLRTLPVEARRLRSLTNVELLENQPDMLSVSSLTKAWDVFISHAAADKQTVAAPLAEQLRQAGLRVWLDQQEIRLGDSIRKKIDDGLSRSRFGIVILSPSFFEREWTARELGAMLAIEDEGQRVVLPVWHEVDRRDVVAYSPILGDIAAADTRKGLFSVASAIIDTVLYSVDDAPSSLHPSITRQAVDAICSAKNVVRLRDLLGFHGIVLKRAFAQFGDLFEARPIEDLGGFPVLLVSSEQFSAGTTIKSYLLLGSLEVGLFNDQLQPSDQLNVAVQALRVAHRRHQDEENNHVAVGPPGRGLRGSGTLWGFQSELRMGQGQPSVIVCGRRYALGPTEKDALNELNSRLAKSGIRVRSYDWLIDAFRSSELESTRRSHR